jgi:ribonuclease P protein 3
VSALGWAEMKKMNETIVVSGKLDEHTSQYQGGRKGPKRNNSNDKMEENKRHWKCFNEYLERNFQDKQLDVVIDGANIGYYEQNFAGAPKHVDYRQIDWVVQHCLRLNKTVLLFLHSRHFSHKLMPRNAEGIVRAWRERGILYSTPPGMNDDWFWMHAALHAGPGTHVLTNDEMRDHHFQMLAQRSFVRWKERHQIHFGFGTWEKDAQGQSLRRRQVDLVYPEIYSRRMQRVQDGLVVPRPKRGDENRFLDGSHTATDDEPIEERYVCIRPKAKLT